MTIVNPETEYWSVCRISQSPIVHIPEIRDLCVFFWLLFSGKTTSEAYAERACRNL